jgi:hypothetical protein
MAPFEALYGHRCGTPLNWIEPGERTIFGPDLVTKAEEIVHCFQSNVKTAKAQQESYGNKRRGERAVATQRFQGHSPRLCQLRTTSFWPRRQALICTGRMLGFMGPKKPSSPVTTLSNRTPCFEMVCWRENEVA